MEGSEISKVGFTGLFNIQDFEWIFVEVGLSKKCNKCLSKSLQEHNKIEENEMKFNLSLYVCQKNKRLIFQNIVFFNCKKMCWIYIYIYI